MTIYTLPELCDRYKITRQALAIAIKSNRLPAKKLNNRWHIKEEDYIQYQNTKYSRSISKYNGELLYDKVYGKYSINEAADYISKKLGKPFYYYNVYYNMQKGNIKATKCGSAWVILKEDMEIFINGKQNHEK